MGLDPKQTDYLLWDLDGTLTDSGKGILRCAAYALEQCGMPVPPEEQLLPFVGPPLMESFQKICGMLPEQAAFAVKKYRERYAQIGMFENKVYEGIYPLLEALQAAGFVMAVATSKPEVYTLQILTYFHLENYFQAVAGCDLNRSNETKADMIRLALRRLGLPEQAPIRTAMIGDRKYDILGAAECGIPCIGVQYGYSPAGELEACHADAVVDSPEDLGRLLLGETYPAF